MTQENKNYIAWIPVIELAVLAFTTLGTTITLFLHSDTKMNEFRKEQLALQKDFSDKWMQETKDFHARLCIIEERGKNNVSGR